MQKTLALAEALNIPVKGGPAAVTMMLEQPEMPEVPEEDYSFHSGGMIDTRSPRRVYGMDGVGSEGGRCSMAGNSVHIPPFRYFVNLCDVRKVFDRVQATFLSCLPAQKGLRG